MNHETLLQIKIFSVVFHRKKKESVILVSFYVGVLFFKVKIRTGLYFERKTFQSTSYFLLDVVWQALTDDLVKQNIDKNKGFLFRGKGIIFLLIY